MKALLFAILLAAPSAAQTVHDVNVGPFFNFTPAHVTVDVGDTVRWTWVEGLHDVKSGVGGITDGIFDSGNPTTPPAVFEVTFDAAFLSANPVPANVYDYFCSIHVSFGMVGSVTVAQPPAVSSFGCLNPPSSLVELSGAAKVGSTWTVGVDNPIPGGQPPGSLAFLAGSVAPAPGFPCGLALPGFHMDPLQPSGELLVSLTAPDPFLAEGPIPWTGPGAPAPFALPIPPNPALVGFELHLQGLIVDATASNTFGASEGLRVTLGG